MGIEFSKSILRVALKKFSEHQMRQENENGAALLSIVNAITEKADTRGWQTLPHSIYYGRIPLKQGENKVKLNLFKDNSIKGTAQKEVDFQFSAGKGEKLFFTYSALEIQ